LTNVSNPPLVIMELLARIQWVDTNVTARGVTLANTARRYDAVIVVSRTKATQLFYR